MQVPRHICRLLLIGLAVGGISSAYVASSDEVANVFLWLAVMLVAAKLATLVERVGQPAVLGELLIGVALGSLGLAGVDFLEPAKQDPAVNFLAQLGVVLLLFQIGMESSIESMRKVGARAAGVGMVGVAVPFVLGVYVAGPWLLPEASGTTHLFLGATLTATSVGITGRVFRDAGALHLPAIQTVLGAAVIDDVLGLIILAVVSSIAGGAEVSLLQVGRITRMAVLFLVGSIALGQWLSPRINGLLAKVQPGLAMKFTMIITLCLVLSYTAHMIGLAPIIGAFAAGLILERSHFARFDQPPPYTEVLAAVDNADPTTKRRVDAVIDHHAEHHHATLIEPLGYFMIPVFFVLTGMQVEVATLFKPGVLVLASALTVVAVIGRLVAGLLASHGSRWLVGWGMVPRGEVGLIFAVVGKQRGVLSESLFSVLVVMVIVTTLITPSILMWLLRRRTNSP
jgi:Kef-type K+ transport system membrane component KefB